MPAHILSIADHQLGKAEREVETVRAAPDHVIPQVRSTSIVRDRPTSASGIPLTRRTR